MIPPLSRQPDPLIDERVVRPVTDIIMGALKDAVSNVEIAVLLQILAAPAARYDAETAPVTLQVLADAMREAAEEAAARSSRACKPETRAGLPPTCRTPPTTR